MAFEFNDPLVFQLRAGTEADPYVSLENSRVIVNNQITLDEIPCELNHVTITGYTEVYELADLATSTFFSNYLNGLITFDQSQEGTTVTASYYGRGVILYPIERLYTDVSSSGVVTTLQSIVDTSAKSITFHTTAPESTDGENGDVWFVYQE